MEIRKTELKDLKQIEEIYSAAKQFMRSTGNFKQWDKDYPNITSATADMERGIGYVCEHEGEVVAVFAFAVEEEPTYNEIYHGAWLNTEKYAYMHRVAVKKQGLGIANFCFQECYKMHPNLKIDTHEDNIPMQRALEKAGFVRCGIIRLVNGEERIAYQKNN